MQFSCIIVLFTQLYLSSIGAQSPAITENRVCGVQAISGTGAGRLAFEFTQRHHSVKTAYISKPTWGNHKNMLKNAGYTDIREYRYFDPATNGLDINGMLADLEAAPEGSIIVLHGCAHNPCGVDPSHEEWKQICDVMQTKKLFTVFDVAYQGFVSGDPDQDAWAIRYFLERGTEMFVCQSYAKNFGLYNERCGNLTVVCANSTIAMKCFQSIEGDHQTLVFKPTKPWSKNCGYNIKQ